MVVENKGKKAIYGIVNEVKPVSDKIPVFYLIFCPKQFIQGLVQFFADGKTKINGGIIVALFYRIDGLAGYSHKFSERLLGQSLGSSC